MRFLFLFFFFVCYYTERGKKIWETLIDLRTYLGLSSTSDCMPLSTLKKAILQKIKFQIYFIQNLKKKIT